MHVHKWTLDIKYVPNKDEETLKLGIHGFNEIFGYCCGDKECFAHINYDEVVEKLNMFEEITRVRIE